MREDRHTRLETAPARKFLAAARRATILVLALHGLLPLISLPDYFVSVDSGYHVSLARWCGEHGTAWWDHINYGPGGRPNLQGPLMHMAVGYFGRALGGRGMDYVHANAILALLQCANLARWSHAVRGFETQVLPAAEMDRINRKLFRDYFH